MKGGRHIIKDEGFLILDALHYLSSLHVCISVHTHTHTHQLAVDLVRKHEAHIGTGYQPIISQAGLTSAAAAQAAAKFVREPAFGIL